MQGFLADGGGDDSVNRSFPQGMGRLFQMVEGVFGGFRVRPAQGSSTLLPMRRYSASSGSSPEASAAKMTSGPMPDWSPSVIQ